MHKPKPTVLPRTTIIPLLLALLAACTGWTMDYGKPAAQFEAADAAAIAGEYMGEKVTVRGKVLAVDSSDPESCIVELEGGVIAQFGDMKLMAEECKVGEITLVDGIVSAVEPARVLLEPALGRDPTAPFEPRKP